MSTAAQLYMTLHRLATAAEAPDAATRTQGISRNELLTLLGISTRANGSLSEAQERAFERAKQTLRDAGARITHVTTDLGERYRLEPSNAAKLPAWNPTAEEFRLINTILRGWEGTELQDDAYRILRKIALTSENLTDGECNTNVVGEHAGAGNNLSACTLDQVGDDQLGGGVALGEIDFGLFAVEVTLTERHGCLL